MTSQKNKIVIGIIAAIVLIAGYYVIAQQAKFARVNVSNPDEVNLKEVTCEVVVANPRGLPLVRNGDLIIESANCEQQYVSSCGRFGVFSDTGALRMEAAGGLGSAVDVRISEGSSQSYNMNWCGSKLTKTFKLKIFDDNNGLLQTKEVTLQ